MPILTHPHPFGMAFADGTNPDVQPYKYGGKELDGDRGLNLYDYSARWKGDWSFLTMDPLAEKYYSISPYVYCANNPMNMVDPDGESPLKIGKIIFNIGRRAYKTYKASGKVNIRKALKQEGLNVVDNVTTLFDEDASTFDKGIALIDLATGFGSEVKRGTKALGIVDEVNSATKNRVKLRKGTKEKIHENAPKTSDGKPIDPNTLEPIEGTPDIGHKPGEEWRKRKKCTKKKEVLGKRS